MTIRPATEADLPALCYTIAQSVRQQNAGDDSSSDLDFICQRHDEDHMRANLLKRDVFVLEVYGVIAGTISLQGDRLHTLFVATKYTRRGLGKLLVKHVENLAIQRGVKALVLSSSRTALPFYEKLGFTKRNFEPREFAPTWAMEKQL